MIAPDKKAAYKILIAMTIGFTTIRLFLSSFFSLLLKNEVAGKLLFYGIYAGCFFIAFPFVFQAIKGRDVLAMVLWSCYCYIMAKTTSIDAVLYVSMIKYILVFGTLNYLLGISVANNQHLAKDVLYALPIPLNLMGIMWYILATMNSSSVSLNTYSMEMTYASLVSASISTVIFLSGVIKETISIRSASTNVIVAIINLTVSYGLVLLGGSRGPLLSLFIIVIICCIYSIKRKKNSVSLFAALVCLLLVAVGLIMVLDFSDSDASSGIRIVDMLQQKDIMNSSGRDHYVRASLQGIKDSILSGMGVFHDRTYVYTIFHRYYAQNSTGSYPHNLFLEFFLQYGVVLGTTLSALLIVLLIRTYRQSIENNSIELICTLMGVGFFPLLVSKSYVQTWEFYMLIGFIIGSIRQRRRLFLCKEDHHTVLEEEESVHVA